MLAKQAITDAALSINPDSVVDPSNSSPKASKTRTTGRKTRKKKRLDDLAKDVDAEDAEMDFTDRAKDDRVKPMDKARLPLASQLSDVDAPLDLKNLSPTDVYTDTPVNMNQQVTQIFQTQNPS